MKKLFLFVIVGLILVNIVACTQGFFLGETIIIPKPEDGIIETDNPNREEESVIDENDEEVNSEQPIEDGSDQQDRDQQDIEEEVTEEVDEEMDKEVDEIEEDGQAESKGNIILEFSTFLPPDIKMDLKYDKYLTSFDYLLVLDAAKVRKGPGLDEEVIRTLQKNEKVPLIAEVKGEYLEKWESDSWYQVAWREGDEVKIGFVYAPLGEVRRYQLEKMEEVLKYLKEESDKGELAYISNYKDANGRPPLLNGSAWDEFGYRRSQSAAGYYSPQKGSNFRYIPDGMLVRVLEERDGFTKVNVIGWEGEYWVQNKYINRKNTLKDLKKVIVIDRKFQNEGVFEFIEGQWTLVSYTLATTGKKGTYSLETPLGYYMAIQKRDKFLYYEDGTQEIAGYAPYAIRFSGGGYIHGVPVNYIKEEGSLIDPGMKEYSITMGTVPLSHMCVRNYTSHAKFIYDWVEIGSSAVVVIE